MLCLLVVLAGTTSLLDNGIDLHRERRSGLKYCLCAAAAFSTGAIEDRIGGGKESRHNTRVDQSSYSSQVQDRAKRFAAGQSTELTLPVKLLHQTWKTASRY